MAYGARSLWLRRGRSSRRSNALPGRTGKPYYRAKDPRCQHRNVEQYDCFALWSVAARTDIDARVLLEAPTWAKSVKSLGVTTLRCTTEKKISTWFSQEACTGVWAGTVFAKAAVSRSATFLP